MNNIFSEGENRRKALFEPTASLPSYLKMMSKIFMKYKFLKPAHEGATIFYLTYS